MPDYYDYDASTGPKGGVGGWDMMDANWGDHNAFSKYLLGWIDPIVISSGTREIILPPASTTSSDNAVLIMPGAVPDSFGEFFLVQYPEPGSGNDPLKAGLNKSLWIWHVDSTLTSGGWGFQYDNSYTSHKLLRLMEADGREEIEKGTGNGDVHDFYLPGQALGPVTVPNTTTYSGLISNVTVEPLIQVNSSMHVNFSIPREGPVARFTANATAGAPPLSVQFTDTSTGTGIAAWSWDFNNDTIIDSTSQNPTYTYTQPGTYSVNLTVTGTYGKDSEVKTSCINVAASLSSAIGIYQNGIWYLDNDGSGTWNTGDRANVFGSAGWTSVLGDWNGDGKTEIGIYKEGTWYLDYNGNGVWDTGIDKLDYFGTLGWTPVAGNWNGDATGTKIGIYKEGTWYLDNDGSGTWNTGDRANLFGAVGWTSVLGDWNGDGKTEIGIYKEGTWYLDYNGNGVWDTGIDRLDYFGTLGWTPVVGNWNGDATGTKIGICKDGAWYLDNDGSGTWNAGDRANLFGSAGWTSVLGDWNGDGKTEIGIYKEGTWYLDYNGNGVWDTGIDKLDYFGTLGWTPVVGKWD